MAYASILYNGDGLNRIYSVPFPYLDQSHVTVEVAGVPVAFTWLSAGQIQTAVAPPTGTANVKIKRSTPSVVTQFTSPSIFRSSVLNNALRSLLYQVQEAFDQSADAFVAAAGAITAAGQAAASATAASGSAATASSAAGAASGSATAAGNSATAAANSAASVDGPSIVRVTSQSFTGPQQAQARANIGAAAAPVAIADINNLQSSLNAKLNILRPFTAFGVAATTDLGSQPEENLNLLGTATITSFGTAPAGTVKTLRVSSGFTLVHNVSVLILPGQQNIVTTANDVFSAFSWGGGLWQVFNYNRYSGQALTGGITRGTAVATTSGTAIDLTGIPAGVNRITVMWTDMGTNGTSPPIIQLRAGGAAVTTGYVGQFMSHSSGTFAPAFLSARNGFPLALDTSWWAAAALASGMLTLVRISGNTWVGFYHSSRSETSSWMVIGSGHNALGSAIDGIRLTTVGGAETFDSGSINLFWE